MSVALSHPTLGRPLLKSLAYGSSIPHIDPADVTEVEIVRLGPAQEEYIAALAEEACDLRARADLMEREIAAEAQAILDSFIQGDISHTVAATTE